MHTDTRHYTLVLIDPGQFELLVRCFALTLWQMYRTKRLSGTTPTVISLRKSLVFTACIS